MRSNWSTGLVYFIKEAILLQLGLLVIVGLEAAGLLCRRQLAGSMCGMSMGRPSEVQLAARHLLGGTRWQVHEVESTI